MQGHLASPHVVTVALNGDIFGLGFLPYDVKGHQCQSVCLASSQALIVALYVITSVSKSLPHFLLYQPTPCLAAWPPRMHG